MSNLSLRTYFAAAALAACLPLATFAATAAAPASAPAATPVAVPGVNLPDFTTLVDKVGPSVVNIRTTTRVSSSSSDLHGLPPGMDDGDMSEFFRRFFGIPMPGTPRGAVEAVAVMVVVAAEAEAATRVATAAAARVIVVHRRTALTIRTIRSRVAAWARVSSCRPMVT